MAKRIVLHVTLENRNSLRSLTISYVYMLQFSVSQYGIYHLWAHTKEHRNA